MLFHKKRQGFIIICLLCISIFSSCDRGFEEMNDNPNAYSEPVIESLFSTAIIRHASANSQISDPDLMEAGAWVQYLASLTLSEFYGDKYLWLAGNYERFWIQAYSAELKETQQIIDLTEDDTDLVNLNAIGRIWRVEVLHRITDMYGDVPYFEAGLGYIDGTYKPKYDKQEDIYTDMLNELLICAEALDPLKHSMGASDFIYEGDVVKWKKFSYSLMLRLGMRLTKVNEQMAEEWVKKAISGGVMESNEDVAFLEHTAETDENWNVNSWYLQNKFIQTSFKGAGTAKLNKTFIDHLLKTNDPRLPFYSTLWQGNADKTQLDIYSAKDLQKGLPGGQDFTSIKDIVPGWNDESITEYSEWNIHTIGSLEAPTIFQSYSEVELLLAEASLRGWENMNSAEFHYQNAVKASIQLESIYPNGRNVDDLNTAADSYLTENPFNSNASFEEQMEQIHTQFWVAQFMQSNVEAYSNWRRTGYPELVPYNYPGNVTGGEIPRRVRYSETDASLNSENYKEAVGRQGSDLFTTRIWWDKE